jgi:hypothetical protein
MEMLWVTTGTYSLPKPKAVVATVRAYGVESEMKFDSVDEFRQWWSSSSPDVRLVVVKLRGKPVLASDLLLGRMPEESHEEIKA